ncbi:hypothetical protein [Vibrio paucivorans]|uniref:Uncharacterized protein n=1 Tax=Vibrio paucivorans TaxID=2829489 RepID=A0A9X3HS93_9VIBR|nr:hypothetical protein [Vibrio paucivorans]MCW8334062.1 hypothetical protein [Vibrio paucivorans]
MTRLVAIVFLSALAFLLIRYRANEKVQKGVVSTLVGGFLVYVATLMIAELTR